MSVDNNHTELVRALAKSPYDILVDISAEKIDLLHGAIGLAGETIEFMAGEEDNDQENVIEEAGDILFYGRMIELRMGYDIVINRDLMRQFYPAGATSAGWCSELVQAAGNVLDLVKKFAIYNKNIADTDIMMQLQKCFYCLDTLLGTRGITLDDARVANIAKLRKRYSSGTYSDQQAQDRADKAHDEASED